jgi:uncharacterized protein YjeT (DUF2065 family)
MSRLGRPWYTRCAPRPAPADPALRAAARGCSAHRCPRPRRPWYARCAPPPAPADPALRAAARGCSARQHSWLAVVIHHPPRPRGVGCAARLVSEVADDGLGQARPIGRADVAAGVSVWAGRRIRTHTPGRILLHRSHPSPGRLVDTTCITRGTLGCLAPAAWRSALIRGPAAPRSPAALRVIGGAAMGGAGVRDGA